jgi:lysozyme family protein
VEQGLCRTFLRAGARSSRFEEAAVDALVRCSPFAAKLKDWSIGGMLTNLERFNGVGYANRGLPSAYVWSGTDQYEKGQVHR